MISNEVFIVNFKQIQQIIEHINLAGLFKTLSQHLPDISMK